MKKIYIVKSWAIGICFERNYFSSKKKAMKYRDYKAKLNEGYNIKLSVEEAIVR